jgi:hypothetical protein
MGPSTLLTTFAKRLGSPSGSSLPDSVSNGGFWASSLKTRMSLMGRVLPLAANPGNDGNGVDGGH